MANNGIMTLDDLINGGILRSSLAADILKASVERAILNNPAIVRTFTGGDLEYKLGFMSATAVEEGVPEGQAVAIETPEFSSLSVPLSKDVVNVAITDEARIRSQSSGYDIISIIQQDASDRLSAIINKKIARALDTTPQTGTSFNIRSTSIYNAIAEAESKMPDGAGITAIARHGYAPPASGARRTEYSVQHSAGGYLTSAIGANSDHIATRSASAMPEPAASITSRGTCR